MPSKTPFLMGNGEGATALADAAPAGPTAAPPNAAPHDAASDVFRKSRLDDELLIAILQGLGVRNEVESQQSKVKGKRQKSFRLSTFDFRLSSDSCTSRQLVEINLRVPLLIRLKQLVPRHFPSAVGGRPSEHGGQRRF